ncbi:MAG TPA: AsmA family protein [Albitalea sp.]|uniref:AsmA family protein n=1 Tax=Piscinibacter sp. TaxID=1903157 RepID=UPI002ED5BB6C
MTPTSRARWRKAAWPLGIVVLLVAAVGVCEWRGWPFLKGPLENQASQRLHREVRFGDAFSLRLLGAIRVATDTLRIGPPQGPLADPAFAGDLVAARDAWLELPYATVRRALRDKDEETSEPLHIRSLRFGQVDASLKRLADGRANWTFGAPPQAGAKAPPLSLPRFDELVVRSGRVGLRDDVTKLALDAQVTTTEGEKTGGDAHPGVVITGNGKHEQRPFEFRVTSSGVLPLVARDDSARVPLTIRLQAPDAKFAFDGTGTDIIGLKGLDGQAALSGVSLGKVGDAIGVTLPTTAPFTLKGRLGKSGEVWTLRSAGLDVGDSRLGGDFRFDRSHPVPLLSGELTGSRMVLADLLPAFGAPHEAPANPRPPAGKVLPQREFDIPSLKAMNADVKVRLQRAELGTLFAQPLEPLQGDLSLNGGVLKIANLVARAAGGEIRGVVGLDGNPPQPLWTGDLRWAGIELEQWLRPRNKTSKEIKPSGQPVGYISGRLGGHAQLQGHGKSTARLIGSLSGTVQAWIRSGSISHLVVEGAGIDLAEALGILIKGDERLPITCAAVRAKAGDGIFVPEVGLIDTGDSTLFIAGSVSLADEKLDLTLITKPKDTSPLTLRSPVRIEGSFSAPKIGLDTKKLATKVGLAAVLASVHPLAALIALFDPGDKEHAGGCEKVLQQLRDANGPAGARDAKAPKASEHAATPGPVRK